MITSAKLVLWVRHAQSTGNVDRRLSHRVFDPPLTALGLAQAAAVANALAARSDLGGRPVLCSPSLRTRQTAEHIVRSIRGREFVDEGLREIDCGSLDGSNDKAAWEIVDQLENRWARSDLDAAYPFGESLRDVLTRMRTTLSRAAKLAEDGPVVLVGHGGSLGLFASQLLAPHERSAFVRLANASVSEVSLTVHGDELSVHILSWNGTQHLDAIG